MKIKNAACYSFSLNREDPLARLRLIGPSGQSGINIVNGIERILSSEFPLPAQRPLFAALDCAKFKTTFGLELPGWEQTLALALSRE